MSEPMPVECDLLWFLDLADSPVTDTTTGAPWPANSRCPECGQVGFGSCADPDGVRSTVREPGGWSTVSRCRCGRLSYRSLSPR